MKKWAVLACLLLPYQVEAKFRDGNDLWQFCETPGNDACMNYVMGVMDLLEIYAQKAFCPSSSVVARQTADIVSKWLRDNPAERDKTAASLVTRAVVEAFPCPSKQ